MSIHHDHESSAADKTMDDDATRERFLRQAHSIHVRTDRMFAVLMLVQWIACILAALIVSPRTWIGEQSATHPHILFAIVFGGLIASLPISMAIWNAGRLSTRLVIAVSQVLFSSLLIHLTGGRIETHFHVFGSLAFLSAYRDWRVLIPATVIVAIDHLLRGIWWPETVFGVATASEWRWLEHAGWVVFEDIFLVYIIQQSVREMHQLARHTTKLESAIGEAVAARRELLASHAEIQKLSLVASKTRHSVIIGNAEGKAEWANEAFSELTGYDISELIGRRPGEILQGPNTDRQTVDRIGERLRRKSSVCEEILNYSKSRAEYWISLEIEPVFDGQGKLTNFISSQIDITERKQRESQLQSATERAEAANHAKSLFLANMSHEIRTPLNAILGFTEVMLRDDEGTDPERVDYLNIINSSGKHLLTLINDVLDLSKIEAGHLRVERISCSPHQLIAEVISAMRVRAEERGVTLEYEWQSGIPEAIASDPHRLKQLLMNLVGNAIKFTERGAVSVAARLEIQGDDGQLTLAVTDTGIGIPQEKLCAIFEPFVQADNSVTREFGGTGLGLAISRKITEALGGSLTVSSEPGVGSTFTATIPTGDLRNTSILAVPKTEPTGDVVDGDIEGRDLTGIRVLLVDDGDTNRKLIQLLLKRHGAEVTSGENGEIAVQRAKEQNFDVILMDMQMPVMDGYTASTRIRNLGYGGPIIALTAHAMLGDRRKCLAAGCSDYLSKPINSDLLISKVVETIHHGSIAKTPGSSALATAATATSPSIRSTLPTGDPEIREIVCEFLESLPGRVTALEVAAESSDFEAIRFAAHALKGAGGTAGFAAFTEPAAQIETLAAQQSSEGLENWIGRVSRLAERIEV